MKSLTAALLIFSCCVGLAMGADSSDAMDMDKLPSIGIVRFRGSTLRVFEVDGAEVAEPAVSFLSSCRDLKFSRVYMKYQLVLPLRIYANTLRSASSKKRGHVTITGLKVKANKGLLSSQSGLTVMVDLSRAGRTANVIFLCSSFTRCRYLREEIVSNPTDIGRALKFEAVGTVGRRPVRFGARRSLNSPRLSCDPHRWVVFQRRVDGSLSFAQNWDAYVKGFGNPKSNYWMGLDRLSAMTKTGAFTQNNPYVESSRCGLRIETEDFRGTKYSSEFGMFQVLGPEQNYRLRVGQQIGSSQLGNDFVMHSEMQFSTFDRDHDKAPSVSCSQLYGFGGWWYRTCHAINLNGAYTTNRSINDNANYCSVLVYGRHTPMKRTLMKFRCH